MAHSEPSKIETKKQRKMPVKKTYQNPPWLISRWVFCCQFSGGTASSHDLDVFLKDSSWWLNQPVGNLLSQHGNLPQFPG